MTMYKITCLNDDMESMDFNVDEENEREAMHAASTLYWNETHNKEFLVFSAENKFRIVVEPLFLVMPVETDD